MRSVGNAELVGQRLPPPGAGGDEISSFALTFDGYARRGSFEKCAEVPRAPTRGR